jgi:hypothetical protein
MVTFTLAIWADERYLGIRCAKVEYGVDLINDVLQGYQYHGHNGMPIARLTKGEVKEDDNCEKCKNPLYMCNAREVTV